MKSDARVDATVGRLVRRGALKEPYSASLSKGGGGFGDLIKASDNIAEAPVRATGSFLKYVLSMIATARMRGCGSRAKGTSEGRN